MKCPHCQGELSQADVQREVGMEALDLGERYAAAKTEGYRKRILEDVQTRAANSRGMNRSLWEMARRFEDYKSVYDCARELREFCQSMAKHPKKPRALTWREKLRGKV